MKRIAHIADGFIANISILPDNFELPVDTMLESDALEQGYTRRPKTEAELAEEYRLSHPPRWIEFSDALPVEVDQLLTAAQAVSPRLALALGVGLGKAADGDSRVFLNAWQTARGIGLVSPELMIGLQGLAVQFDLPAEFVAGLAASQ
jgi:hypothetical protein